MKPKTIKRSYWTITILFALAMLQSGIVQLIPTEGSIEVMEQLSYPLYLSTILGIGKVLGVIALIQPIFPVFKEWAYAGFTIDFLGASTSGVFVGSPGIIITPLVFLAVMFVSYFLWKKMQAEEDVQIQPQQEMHHA